MDLILQILTNPDRVTKKPSNILWKPTGNFAIHLMLFADEINLSIS